MLAHPVSIQPTYKAVVDTNGHSVWLSLSLLDVGIGIQALDFFQKFSKKKTQKPLFCRGVGVTGKGFIKKYNPVIFFRLISLSSHTF
jgi:hypothetical protein